jgi:hypothetical protein
MAKKVLALSNSPCYTKATVKKTTNYMVLGDGFIGESRETVKPITRSIGGTGCKDY